MFQFKQTRRKWLRRWVSYASVVPVLVIAGLLLLGLYQPVAAAVPAVNPQSGSVGLTGAVRGPAPSVAATILTPGNGSRTSNIPVTVSGTCPAGSFVEITKNNAFAGVTTCQADGRFSLLIDLFDGANTLVARVSDALGQYGPDSKPVLVYYDAPALAQPGGIGRQLFLRMDTTVVAGNPGQPISRSVIIVGGIGPYAISWDWGDETTSLSSQANDGNVTASHVYERPGTYRVIVRVTDSTGNSAFLQFITIVNGPVDAIGKSQGGGMFDMPGALIFVWPLLIFVMFLVIAFWLGERREVRKLQQKHLLP